MRLYAGHPAGVDVAALLIRARVRARMSRTQLAGRAGTSPSALSAYERGIRSPSVATLDRLLAACGLQLRVDLEPYLADLDAVIDRWQAETPEVPADAGQLALAFTQAGLTWAFDGRTALALHGLAAGQSPAEVVAVGDAGLRRFLYELCVDAVDRDGRILWDSWLDIDLSRAAPALAWTRVGAFVMRIVAELEPPLWIQVEGDGYPVLGLLAVEQAHPALADLLARLRDRRTVCP